MGRVEIVVAHDERVTLRVGDAYLKIDSDQALTDGECEWLVTSGVLPADLVTRNRRIAEAALRPWTSVFAHGDLQVTHVFVDGDEVTGVIDPSSPGAEFDVLRSAI